MASFMRRIEKLEEPEGPGGTDIMIIGQYEETIMLDDEGTRIQIPVEGQEYDEPDWSTIEPDERGNRIAVVWPRKPKQAMGLERKDPQDGTVTGH
jgi:hypothetical protein